MGIVILILLILIGGDLYSQQTEHVVVAVIDGARYTETFGDPSHQYIPNIWNNLRPNGTIYTSFYNDGVTQTNSGHSSIVTGTWQSISNDGGELPHMPTIFEYLRKTKNLPISETRVILGKEKLDILSCSDHPEFGSSYAALVNTTSYQYDDVFTLENLKSVISTSHPRLMIANLAGTDRAGHDGPWSNYIEKLRRSDSCVSEIWNFIQSDPLYQNKTTLIVTNDHGRHTTNFSSHGDGCDGCRHIMTLVIGPDTPSGIIDSTRHLQTDIAPTIGLMLGFGTSYSTGEPLPTAFSSPIAGNYSFSAGWNLISVPRKAVNMATSELFPTATTAAIAYSDGYVTKDTLKTGIGYWLKFDAPAVVPITGFQNIIDSIDIVAGWNIIGSLSIPVPRGNISSDDPEMSLSHFFRFSAGYVTSDTLHPSFGYWIKANKSGKIYLNPQAAAAPVNRAIDGDLPPPPPGLVSEPVIPKTISLIQNYPNPFNPATRIEYRIPQSGRVRLNLFDQLGKEIVTLLDEYRDAGAHAFDWNSDHLPGGVYYCRLESLGQILAIKMILIK